MSRREQIIEIARDILEHDGPHELTMRAIASRLEIQAPSLYKHIADKHELEVALITQGFIEQAEAFDAAVDRAEDPVAALGLAYRAWALRHPHLYGLMTNKPLPREDLPEGVEDAATQLLLDAVDGDADHARALWAFAHGMVTLELADRFPPDADLDIAWAIGVTQFGDQP